MLRARAVGPFLGRAVDPNQHRLGAGDLAGREHDLGDSVREIASGQVEQGVVDVDLHDPVVDSHRVATRSVDGIAVPYPCSCSSGFGPLISSVSKVSGASLVSRGTVRNCSSDPSGASR